MCKIEIFDGAMGTMLQAGGLQPGACPELMNVENPEVVKNIHRAYIEAGATIIETNTFGASPLKLEHYGLTDRMAELNAAAVKIAKTAAQGRAKVAGSMGPTGRWRNITTPIWRRICISSSALWDCAPPCCTATATAASSACCWPCAIRTR